MNDPKRLHEMQLDPRTRRIIAAGLEDFPPRERLERIAVGIGGGAVVALGAKVAVAEAAGGAAAAPLVSAALIAKWLSVGLFGGIVVSLGLSELGTDTALRIPSADTASHAHGSAAVPVLEAHERPLAEPGTRSEDVPEADVTRARSVPLGQSPRSKRDLEASNLPAGAPPSAIAAANGSAMAFPPTGEVEASALREEVALIAQAKAALDRGAPAEALARLNAYRSRFTNGRLEPEASAIELEANVALGNRARATEIARRLATGSGPSAERARQVLEGGSQ